MARPLGRDEQARRRAERVGFLGVVAATILPVVLWHEVIADIARVTVDERAAVLLVGWAPWALMSAGILCAVPAAVNTRRARHDRFYRPGAGAWQGWGVTLYVLGFGLATQVAQLHGLST